MKADLSVILSQIRAGEIVLNLHKILQIENKTNQDLIVKMFDDLIVSINASHEYNNIGSMAKAILIYGALEQEEYLGQRREMNLNEILEND